MLNKISIVPVARINGISRYLLAFKFFIAKPPASFKFIILSPRIYQIILSPYRSQTILIMFLPDVS